MSMPSFWLANLRRLFVTRKRRKTVNLLFSLLTVPLDHLGKQLHGASMKGCINHLYKSVYDLDEQSFNSTVHKEMLVSPKVAPGFSYENDLLGIEEASHPQYYYYRSSPLRV